jgi:deoxyribonuclease IV
MKKILIGCHVSMNAPDYLLGSVKEALSYGASTFMVYTGAPQNTIRKPIKDLKIFEALIAMNEASINPNTIVVHAPYLINLANTINPQLFDNSIQFIISELKRTAAFHAPMMVLHPGSHLKQGEEVGLNKIVEGLDKVFAVDVSNVKIALETMAGKGSELGTTFQQLKYIIDHSKYPHRLGVCLDTCHVHDAGYDVFNIDELLNQFDNIIGLDKLLVIHVNDSKNERGAHKDRHDNLGYGHIGFEVLSKYVHHPKLKHLPKILETPWFKDKPPYEDEIQMLINEKYINDWRDKY